MRVLLLPLLLLSCCGPCRSGVPRADSRLQPYYAWLNTRNIPISFATEDFDDATTVGQCVTLDGDDEKKFILIKKATWDVASEGWRRNLILHELGHCQFDRDHDKRLNQHGLPCSVMYPNVFLNPSDFVANEDAYVGQLTGQHPENCVDSLPAKEKQYPAD